MNTDTRQVECIIPVLRVASLTRSVHFYTETLGFTSDWGVNEGDTIGSVSRDRCAIMLSQESGGSRGAWVWIGLEDDSLFEEVRKKGVRIVQEPRNRPWAYEMKVEDIDGNVLWLGTEPRTNQPFDE